MGPQPELEASEYRKLEELRFQIRNFLHFSQEAARGSGLEPQQHQALLILKAAEEPPTIGHLAARLLLKHHSAVELVDRLEALRFVTRVTSPDDARQVIVRPTSKGERVLHRLSVEHRRELEQSGPRLAAALRALTNKKSRS